ncbi:hypothetical protein [Fervidobacterium islandicum]|uniref:hypothetical protein n=1 Tax=Fervidobacterium islandicum TaxID=2423 RepID=UPI003A6B3D02
MTEILTPTGKILFKAYEMFEEISEVSSAMLRLLNQPEEEEEDEAIEKLRALFVNWIVVSNMVRLEIADLMSGRVEGPAEFTKDAELLLSQYVIFKRNFSKMLCEQMIALPHINSIEAMQDNFEDEDDKQDSK